MRLLWLAHSDYANSGAWFAAAMRAAGHQCRMLVELPHAFDYPHQGEYGTNRKWKKIEKLIKWADIVHIVQSDLPIRMGGEYPPLEYWQEIEKETNVTVFGFRPKSSHRVLPTDQNFLRQEWLDRLSSEKVVVLHGGSFYRQVPEFYKKMWDGIAHHHVCYSGDLMGHQKNETLILPPVDLNLLKPKEELRNGLQVAHYPSSTKTKGTPEIIETIQRMPDKKFYFRHSILHNSPGFPGQNGCATVTWEKQLKRMSECDVYIDQIKATEYGKPYGEWVSAASEAAALGCVVIANSRHPNHYVDTYGEMPGIHICNDMEALQGEIERLSSLSRPKLDEERKESRAWVERCHSFERTAEIMEEQVYA